MVWAQQPSSDCQAEQGAVVRYHTLLRDGIVTQQELASAETALRQCQWRTASLQLSLQRLRDEVSAGRGAQPENLPKIALPDRWWKNPVTSEYLGLNADQQKKMDDVLQQFRSRLMVDNTELQQQEAALEPLVSAAPLDEAKITAQIDRVAEARAELEKTNGRMLLGIRKLLTPEQWVKLNQAFTLNLTQK
jgi:Spy/CpxP family protein refolding chaperone